VATWASLTTDQQKRVQDYLDKDLRSALLNLGRSLAAANLSVMPQYLSSPSGAASTVASPAADSIAGILATLAAGEVVPISSSGLALAGSPLASKVAAYTVALNNLVGTNFTAAIQQDLAVFVGSPNLVGQ
jgi:hypothetical protein